MIRILLVFTMVWCSFLAQSQIKFGVIAGYNYSLPKYATQGDSLDNHSASGQSFSGGVFGSYEFNDNFELLAELLVSGRHHNSALIVDRSHAGFDYYEEHFSSVQTFNLEVPILASGKMVFRKGRYGNTQTLSGFVGPSFMVNLSDKYYRNSAYRISIYNQESIEKEEVFESPIDYRSFNIGIIAGVQYEFTFGLRVGARFQTNFMKENKNPDFDLRYSQIQVNLGYTIFNN